MNGRRGYIPKGEKATGDYREEEINHRFHRLHRLGIWVALRAGDDWPGEDARTSKDSVQEICGRSVLFNTGPVKTKPVPFANRHAPERQTQIPNLCNL